MNETGSIAKKPQSRFRKIIGSPFVLMGLLLVFWGSYGANNKIILQELDSYQNLFYTFLFGAVLFLCVFRKKIIPTEKFTPREGGILAACIACHFTYYFTYTWALQRIPALEASMLNYLYPLMVVLFACIFFKEKLTPVKVFAVLLGFLGVWIIVTKGALFSFTLSNPLADLAAFSAAVCWGLFTNLDKFETKNAFFRQFLNIVCCVVLSFIAMMLFSHFTLPSPVTALRILWTAFASLTVGLLLWLRLIRIAPTPLVAGTAFLTPFVSLLFIRFFLGEKIVLMQIVGFAVVVVGVLLQSGLIEMFRDYLRRKRLG